MREISLIDNLNIFEYCLKLNSNLFLLLKKTIQARILLFFSEIFFQNQLLHICKSGKRCATLPTQK